MSGKGERWWDDEVEPGEEYVEYFDARARRWIKVPRHMVEDWQGPVEGGPFQDSFQDYWEYAGSDSEGGWAVFDSPSPSESLLKGRGEVRRAVRQAQPSTGLKLYLVLSSAMAGLLAVSGRWMELGIVGASIAIVLIAWRWRGGWA